MDDRIHEPAIDIEAIRWERINLVIEGRVADGAAEADKVAEFAARHFAHLDGGASDRVIDELILGGPR